MTATRSSIIERLGQANRHLAEDLSRLDEAVHQESAPSLTALRTLLGMAYAHLCEHFRLEEQHGFLMDLQEREPRLARTAQELIAEQRELRQALDTLCGEAEGAVRVDDTLRERVRQWIVKMRRHETRANDLLQDAVGADIAAED